MEKELFYEIPAHRFHSAVLTTYSFNSYFFQQQAIKELGRKGIYNIAVLTDSQMLTEHLIHLATFEDHEERYYGITGIKSKGAFHPKLNFFIGDDALLCILGSGNLTSSGHGKNREVFTTLYADSKKPQLSSILQQIWVYIESIADKLKGISKHQILSARNNCSLLREKKLAAPSNIFAKASGDIDIAFLSDNSQESIFKQLRDILPSKIKSISVISPFYDVNGEMLSALRKEFKFPLTRITLQNNFGQHPIGMTDFKNVKIYNWDEVNNNEISEKSEHFLHAKIFLFDTEGSNYCLIGSANPSVAAFGKLNAPGNNQEACFLLRSKRVNFYKELGLKFSGLTTYNLNDFECPARVENMVAEHGSYNIHILSAEKTISHIELYLTDRLRESNCVIRFLNKDSQVIHLEKVKLLSDHYTCTVTPSVIKCIQQVVIVDSLNKEVSNRQLLQNTEQIQRQNPSETNRNLNKLLSRAEIDIDSPISYIQYLTDLNSFAKHKTYLTNRNKDDHSSGLEKKMNSEEISHKTYEEFISETKNISIEISSVLQNTYSKVKVLDLVFSYFKLSSERKEQGEIDFEEEEQNIDESFGTEEKDHRPQGENLDSNKDEVITPIDVHKERKKLISLVDTYIYSLHRVKRKSKGKLNLVDLAEFILIMKLLAECADYEVITPMEGKSKPSIQFVLPIKNNTSDVYTFPRLALSVIGKFSDYIGNLDGIEDYSDSLYFLEKFERYMAVTHNYGLLAFAFSSLSNAKDVLIMNSIEQNALNLKKALQLKGNYITNSDALELTFKNGGRKELEQSIILNKMVEWDEFSKMELIKGSIETTSRKYTWLEGMGYSMIKKSKAEKSEH